MTKLQQTAEALFEALLDRDLGDYVHRSRTAGTSWRNIERELAAATGGKLTLSFATLREWYGLDNDRSAA